MSKTKKIKLAENDSKAAAFSVGTKMQTSQIGSSGTKIFGGYLSEEYLHNLRGMEAAEVWDKMRRSESQVAMLMAAITNPIKSASWEIEPASQDPEHVKQAELIKEILFTGIDFETFKHEAMTFVPFGFSIFEVVHNVVFNHPKFGTFNGLQSIGFRSQKTILSWNLERKSGKLLAVDQQAYGDVADNVTIPGDFLIVFTNQKEGDNYEGISVLRPMYGAYQRKQLYLKLTAIGVEKYAVGTPIGTVPKGKEGTPDFAKFKEVLESYTSHEKAYITKPEGWDIELQKTEFNADKIVQILQFENTEMINSVVANFLALGTGGNGGAFALSNDLSDFFTAGIQNYADIVACGLNRKLIPDLCKLNYGQLDAYPKIKVTGISDKAGKELSEIISTLVGSKTITPDMPLEEFLRRQYKLPKQDKTTAKPTEPVLPTPTQDNVKLSEVENEFTKSIDVSKGKTKALMQARLRAMADDLKKKLKAAYSQAGSDAAQIAAPTKVEISQDLIDAYEKDLREELAKQAVQFIDAAEKEVKGKSVKLDEYVNTVLFASPKGAGFYEALPTRVKALVQSQAALLASSQPADISKIVTFQFASSATSTDNVNTIDQDVEDAVSKTLEGSNARGMSIDAAAGDVVAHVANQARLDYFFDPEVLSGIESFTFENNDPVSEICQSLAGTTFAVNDPQLDQYGPPLHHNCKSRLVPNNVGDKNNPEISGSVKPSESALKSMTL